MANEVGTASNLEDLFGKIITFLTTNAALVAADQEWEVLRVRRDNLLSCTSNLASPSNANYRRIIQTCRYDSRSLNSDNPAATDYRGTYSSGSTGTWTAGSNVTWRFRQAREVKTVRLQAAIYATFAQYMFKNFRLQYSDDGSAWTTALTVSSTPNYSAAEWRDFAVPGTPGAHEYWRILQDTVQTGTQVAWSAMVLLEADGTVANQFGSEVLFKARGNAGADAIYTGIRSEYDDTAGWYNLFLNGYTGYDPSEQSWFRQPGALPGFESGSSRVVPMVPCWNSAMPYWFAASGRSFRMGVKVSTVYEGAYLGFILPWATPGQYPYPLAVGGSMAPSDVANDRSSLWRYSATSPRHGVFPGPGISREDGYSSNDPYPNWSSLYLRLPDGTWKAFQNRVATGTDPEAIQGPTFSSSSPYNVNGGSPCSAWPHCVNASSGGWNSGMKPWRECLGGGYLFQPVILLAGVAGPQVYGEFEGVYAVSGYQNGAENTSTVDGTPVVIMQNAYRTTVHEFWAMSLDA